MQFCFGTFTSIRVRTLQLLTKFLSHTCYNFDYSFLCLEVLYCMIIVAINFIRKKTKVGLLLTDVEIGCSDVLLSPWSATCR